MIQLESTRKKSPVFKGTAVGLFTLVLLILLKCADSTTILAATFNGGVVVGADSRTSTGNLIANRNALKVHIIGDRSLIARSGGVADTQHVAEIVQRKVQKYKATHHGFFPPTKVIAHLIRRICYNNKDLSSSIIIAGWDKEVGPSVFSVALGGALIRENIACCGSGSAYIAGVLDSEWLPGMGLDECKSLVRRAIRLAMGRDSYSGGAIRLWVVTCDSCKETLEK
eukprot:523779_1